MARPPATKGTNTSTRHVFEALGKIAQSDEPIDLPRLAKMMNLPNSTAHRALMTLEECGMARRVEGGARFIAGDMVHHLIRSMVAQFPIRHACADALREMSEAMDVTVTLNCRVGWYSIRLFSVEGSQESYQLRRIGEVRPLHDGVGPRTILAALGEDEHREFTRLAVRSGGLGGRKPDKRLLADDRAKCARQGYIEQPPSDYSVLTWFSFPILSAARNAVSSVSIGLVPSRVVTDGHERIVEDAKARIAALQARLDDDPALTRLPFGDQPPGAFELPAHRVLPMSGRATGT